MPFVFYDTETTGIDTTFDQILQFAAILADDELNELDRFELRCRLLAHVVPSPGALRATHVTPSILVDAALPSHYQAICAIADKLRSWSPAVFIGYNSLGFDETLLRQAFYQNLKPTYLTNTNGNARADALRLVQAASIYAPHSIIVPLTEEGRPTRRLDTIAPANGYNDHDAHDALGDVEATIYMARLVKQRAPHIWDALMPLATKPAVIQRALSGQLLSLTEFFKGKPYSWLVVGCGQNPQYDAQLGVFDLRYDPQEYLDLTVEGLIDVMNSKTKAIRCIRGNNQPILLPRKLAQSGLHNLEVSDQEIEARARLISEASDFRTRIGEAIKNRYPEQEASAYVEERIYDGFPSRTDEFLMRRFHELPWTSRADILNQIEDLRVRELGYRIIYAEAPDILTPQKRAELDAWQHQRRSPGTTVPWRTIRIALEEVEDLFADANTNSAFIREIRFWLEGQARLLSNPNRVLGKPSDNSHVNLKTA
jgi:exodeoxyribonuclease-1